MQHTLVQRLRDRAYSFKAPDPLMEEAANEIERLRGYRDEAEAEASIAGLVVERLRLTSAEREAIEWAARAADPDYTGHPEILRSLLIRLGLRS